MAAEMGRRGYRKAAARYAWPRVASEYERAYRSAIAGV
jgi:hypothetical protein